MKILVSAGEASSDRHAARLVEALRRRLPEARFFGCAGPRLREAGVEPVIRAESLAVVGVFEVVGRLPHIYGQYRTLLGAAGRERPDLALLVDSPDFNLRVAAQMRRLGVPTAYYVAPQLWAWRPWRIRRLRRDVDLLLVIFPFEEEYFRSRGVETVYVGHPLIGEARATLTREEFHARHGLRPEIPLLAILPGSREGEAARHLPDLMRALEILRRERPLEAALPVSPTIGAQFFEELARENRVHIVENDAANVLAHADVGWVASGTATVEAALLDTPMAAFYRVSRPTWLLGRLLVRTPYYSMVNLLAGEPLVPELIQNDLRPERLADEAKKLLDDPARRERMRAGFRRIRETLTGSAPAAERAADAVCQRFFGKEAKCRTSERFDQAK